MVCPFMVIFSVLANDCQNSASLIFCCRFALAFFRRRAFLEDKSLRKSIFCGFWVFFLGLIVFPFTAISQVLIKPFFLGVTRIQFGYNF
jgi:hypothetical protein